MVYAVHDVRKAEYLYAEEIGSILQSTSLSLFIVFYMTLLKPLQSYDFLRT